MCVSKLVDAACHFHQYYGLCQRRCKKKKPCLMHSYQVAHTTAPTTATLTRSPSFYRIGEERRHSRRERSPRRWMVPPLSFRMIG